MRRTAQRAELAKDRATRDREAEQAQILAREEVEKARLAQERVLAEVRIQNQEEVERREIVRRRLVDEAEIVSAEELERARIGTERGLAEARLARDESLRRLEIEKDKLIEIAELQCAIEVARKTSERSAAIAAAEDARAAAIAAEENAISVRERAIAERRKETDLIAAACDNEREAQRLTTKADAEKKAAADFGEAQRTAAQAEADAEKLRAAAAATRYEVEAKGAQKINEAENLLSEEARQSRLRSKLLDKIEGIVRESVKPMEKIEAIKILHIDGVNGTGSGPGRNVTDEVIDSALRYRVQAPMIDSLLKEIGIEGGSLGRMTDVLRDAKDIQGLVSKTSNRTSSSDDDNQR